MERVKLSKVVFFLAKMCAPVRDIVERVKFSKVVVFFSKNVCTSEGYSGESETKVVFFLAKMCAVVGLSKGLVGPRSLIISFHKTS